MNTNSDIASIMDLARLHKDRFLKVGNNPFGNFNLEMIWMKTKCFGIWEKYCLNTYSFNAEHMDSKQRYYTMDLLDDNWFSLNKIPSDINKDMLKLTIKNFKEFIYSLKQEFSDKVRKIAVANAKAVIERKYKSYMSMELLIENSKYSILNSESIFQDNTNIGKRYWIIEELNKIYNYSNLFQMNNSFEVIDLAYNNLMKKLNGNIDLIIGHGDLRPNNIYVNKNTYEIKVIDPYVNLKSVHADGIFKSYLKNEDSIIENVEDYIKSFFVIPKFQDSCFLCGTNTNYHLFNLNTTELEFALFL